MDNIKRVVELPVCSPSNTTGYYDPMMVASIEPTSDPNKCLIRLKGDTEQGGSFIPLTKEKIAELLEFSVVKYQG